MYLKSLTLKGFKSFADRAHMVFEPGLTVIVGPNGSGKSNVSDAILWVLGEQSAKQLRGQAMEDVVFAGSSARKPVSVAEVDLCLDNSDHTLPVDFDEVVITRRMYRSGESEYLINGAPARLLDITDILHDSGLGKDTHSIIGQGKLDQILVSRPEDRRALIEEAAGISKHKRRRERSLRKLASMDEHLRRALDVQKEITRQLRPLERQVERAQRHNEIAGRVGSLRIELAVDDLRRLQARWNQLENTEVEASAELSLAEYQLKERQGELEKLQLMLEEKGLFVGDLSEQRRRCQSIVERLGAGARLLEEKGRGMTARHAAASSALQKAERRDAECRTELEAARAERDGNRGELRVLRERMDAANARVRAARERRREAEDALTKTQTRLRTLQRDRDAAAVALAKARDGLESARVQDDIFATRLSQLEEAIAAAACDEQAAAARLEEARAGLEQARASESESRLAVERARAGLAAAQKAEGDARRALAAAEARAAGLEQAVRAGENATPLAGRLAQNAPAGLVDARVSEVLDVPAELASLVEHLLAGSVAGFVAADADALAGLASSAERLCAQSAGQVEIVSRAASAPASDGALLAGYALLERISVRPGYEAAARALLGGVRVVETLEEACAASAADPHGTYVTPTGTRAFAGGRTVVGRVQDASAGLLESRRKLRELEAELPALREASRTAQQTVADAEAQISQCRRDHEAHAAAAARLSGEVSSLTGEAARLRSSVEKSQGELARLAQQREQAARRSAEAREAAERHAAALEAAEGQIAELEASAGGQQEAFDSARREERSAHDEANSCQLELARVNERTSSLEARCTRLEREAAELAGGLDGQRAEVRALELTGARVEPLRRRFAALQEAAAARAALLRDRASLAEADSATLKKTIEDARRAVADAQLAHSRAQVGMNEVKVEKGRLEVKVDTAVKAITAQPGVILEEALELPEPADRAASERELQKLETQLAAIGPVNQVAFEEYETLKRRADYITEQVEDLQHARADLTKILSAIDRKMRNSFTSTFETVNKNFQEIFAMLFPGGNGHLELTVPDDPATTGIEVVAQPRGKRVTKMSLLSGGERSLTALGLLFAVYRTRTVPFYVLDEVEAALDDSNLDRLLHAIEVLRASTQLIVISHQRRTMESADVLYGVSMQADGVSRVVSQKLDRQGNPVGA